MTKVEPITNESVKSESEELRKQRPALTPIDHILQKLSPLELPAKEYFERYMRHKWRMNHKPKTLQSSFTSVRLFLAFYGESGKRDLEEIERVDLEAFIELCGAPHNLINVESAVMWSSLPPGLDSMRFKNSYSTLLKVTAIPAILVEKHHVASKWVSQAHHQVA